MTHICKYCSATATVLYTFPEYEPACKECYRDCIAQGVAGSLRRMSVTSENYSGQMLRNAEEILRLSPKFGKISFAQRETMCGN